jgi:hypothetical protein
MNRLISTRAAFDMLEILLGAVMVIATSAFYWYLLPRNGQVNRLVRNTDVGSMVTITIMSIVIVGIAILCDGLFG